MRNSSFLTKLGGTLWLIFAGVAMIVVALQWFGVVELQAFPWRGFAMVLGIGGLGCFILAGILAIWEQW